MYKNESNFITFDFVNLWEKKSSKKSEQSEKPSGVSRAK